MADTEPDRIVSATRVISARADRIFELIADPSRQPSWDGNGNLASAAPGQRVRGVGDIFKTTLTNGDVRENHVVEFIEGSKIAWRPAEPRKQPPGHLWRWELSPVNPTLTTVTHTYDWTALTDSTRLARARATTAEMLRASMDRLAGLAQASEADSQG
ncbi:MAG: SRPBCC family protein [Mycobacterium sp.]|uniref:SRPBCC family protein n=1 Tax=Mycobacterium sp. TaxID=1785 RepID=UPI001EC575D0|nr:SRPBCC family protein [Mycobacterium sp.]MBW0019437.1 SRPBCC family protein [Mycobacterium sp.]